MIVQELMSIGFCNITDVVRWQDSAMVYDAETQETSMVHNISIRASEDLGEVAKSAIAEVSQSRDGNLKIKMHDKRAALVDLGKYLGMFKPEKAPPGEIHIHFSALMKGVL